MNYKLKHSRLLTCYSALAYFLALFADKGTVSPMDALAMVQLSPTQRLEWLLSAPGVVDAAKAKVHELLADYEGFLQRTDSSEESLIRQFMEPNPAREPFAPANQFGDKVYQLIQLLGRDTRLHRLLSV